MFFLASSWALHLILYPARRTVSVPVHSAGFESLVPISG